MRFFLGLQHVVGVDVEAQGDGRAGLAGAQDAHDPGFAALHFFHPRRVGTLCQGALGVLFQFRGRRHTHHAFRGDDFGAGLHLVTERGQRIGDEGSGAELGPGHLGVAVQIAPPLDGLGREGQGQFVDALFHSSPLLRRRYNRITMTAMAPNRIDSQAMEP